MKRMICFCLLAAMLVSCLIPVSANSVTRYEETIILENGDYIKVILTESLARSSKTGSKSYTYYSEGTARWKGVLTADFTYDGTDCSSTSASCSVTVYDTSYSVANKYTYRSENTATASITMNFTAAGVTKTLGTFKIPLSCDENGNLS